MQPRSTRLNQANRAKFLNAVLKDTLPPSAKPQLVHFQERWAPKIYDIVFGPYLEIIKQMPPWMLITTDSLRVKMPNKSKAVLKFQLPHSKTMPYGYSDSGYYFRQHTAPIPEGNAIVKDYEQHLQNAADYETKKRELIAKVKTLVNTCNTSGQLYKAWPDAVKYADCFPYTAPNRHAGADVSQTEMDLSILMSKAVVKLPNDET